MAFIGSYTLRQGESTTVDLSAVSATVNYRSDLRFSFSDTNRPFSVEHVPPSSNIKLTGVLVSPFRTLTISDGTNSDSLVAKVDFVPDGSQILDTDTDTDMRSVRLYGAQDKVELPQPSNRAYFKTNANQPTNIAGFTRGTNPPSFTATTNRSTGTIAYGRYRIPIKAEVPTEYPTIYRLSPGMRATIKYANILPMIPTDVRPSLRNMSLEVTMGGSVVKRTDATQDLIIDAIMQDAGGQKVVVKVRDTSKEASEQVVSVWYFHYLIVQLDGTDPNYILTPFTEADGVAPPTGELVGVGEENEDDYYGDEVPAYTYTRNSYEGTIPDAPSDLTFEYVVGNVETHQTRVELSLEDPWKLFKVTPRKLTAGVHRWPPKQPTDGFRVPWPLPED